MTIDTKKLKSWPFEAVRQSYTWQDAAVYALGVGYGHDPLDTRQLRYVYEGRDGAVDATRMELATVPTMAVVLATPGASSSTTICRGAVLLLAPSLTVTATSKPSTSSPAPL